MENVDNTMDLFKALLALLVVIGVIGIPAYFILKGPLSSKRPEREYPADDDKGSSTQVSPQKVDTDDVGSLFLVGLFAISFVLMIINDILELDDKISVFQYILMVIGLITLGWGLYYFGKKLLILLFGDMCRGVYSYDYLFHLEWIVQMFEKRGFRKNRFSCLNPGSERPGIRLVKGKDKVVIYLVAPLTSSDYRIQVILEKQDIMMEIPDEGSIKYSFVLEKWVNHYFEIEEEPTSGDNNDNNDDIYQTEFNDILPYINSKFH